MDLKNKMTKKKLICKKDNNKKESIKEKTKKLTQK